MNPYRNDVDTVCQLLF